MLLVSSSSILSPTEANRFTADFPITDCVRLVSQAIDYCILVNPYKNASNY